MRVVSGSARGCRLQPVPGMNTRPTTDRVKENVFNLIQDYVRDADVLDLFAGTGQLGIEALSRGAAHCDFIEHNGVQRRLEERPDRPGAGPRLAPSRRGTRFSGESRREKVFPYLPRPTLRRNYSGKCAFRHRKV